jgi:hypothetical protein
MSEERHEVTHEETHEVSPAEAPAEPVETVVAAEAAVALAEATAASAELQAAETIRQVETGAEEWRTTTAARVNELGTQWTQHDALIASLHSRVEENAALQTAMAIRLEELEASRSPSSIPQASEPEAEGGAPIVGASGEAAIGPIEAGAGAGLATSEVEERPSPPPQSGPLRRRRWI